MDYINIKLSRETGVATVMLARPDALNALSPALLEELSDALSVVAGDESLKALVLREREGLSALVPTLPISTKPSKTRPISPTTCDASTIPCSNWRTCQYR